MRAVEGITDLNGDRHRLVHRQHRRSLQTRRQCLALQVLQHDVVELAVAADVVNRTDVRIVERRNRPRLLLETLTRLRIRGERPGQDLDGDCAIEPCIARPIHLAHATFADGTDDFIGAESGARIEGHVHCILRRRSSHAATRKFVLRAVETEERACNDPSVAPV
jgi:hypothetical protein